MVSSIPLTGLAANDPVPGVYTEVNFAQGTASSGQTEYSVLLMGNRLSTGSAADDGYVYGPDTATPFTSEADAIALFGQGSELHRMTKKFLKVNKSTSLYAICVKESVGAQATLAIAVGGSTATANSTLRVWVQDEYVDVSVVSGDTPTTVAAALEIAINSMGDWAVTGDSTTGTCTLTAKQKGLRGNFLRASAKFQSACGLTVTPAYQTAFSGGTTADSNTNALATIVGTRFYQIVSAAEDASQFGALVTQIGTQAAPIVGIRQRAIAGSVDSEATAQAIAIGINAARAEMIWQQNSDWTPAELATSAMACYSLFEAPASPKLNFSGFGNDAVTAPFWSVKAPLVGTVPTRVQIKAALNNGLSPIAPSKGGKTYLVKRITTRSLNGSVPDYRIRDAHKVTVCDRYADDLSSKVSLQLSGKVIGNDPAKGQRVGGADVVYPQLVKKLIDSVTSQYDALGLLQNVSDIVSGTIVIREASPTTRISAKVPLEVADIADIFALQINQL
jgi:phage tail sheath gpL-like